MNTTFLAIFSGISSITSEIEKTNFSTILVFYEQQLPNIYTSIPNIIMKTSKIPFSNERSRNQETLTLLYLESIDVLDRVSDHFQYTLDSNILIISKKLTPEVVFLKCYQLDLPNIILYFNNTYFSYCFKYPIFIFKILKESIFKTLWYDRYMDQDCLWDMELSSRRKKFGQYKDLHFFFSRKVNAVLNITDPETRSEKPYLIAKNDGLNATLYSEVTNLEYLSIILVVPITFNHMNNDNISLVPFSKASWALILVSLLYFILAFGILSEYWRNLKLFDNLTIPGYYSTKELSILDHTFKTYQIFFGKPLKLAKKDNRQNRL